MSAKSEGGAGLFMRLLLLTIFAVLPLSSPNEGRAQPAVTVSATPDSVLVGDRIHCTITVHHPKGESAVLTGISSFSAFPFELINRKQLTSTHRSGSVEDIFQLELALFGAGREQIPAFTIVLRDMAGRVTSTVTYRPANSVFVRELTDASLRDLRPIKPPYTTPVPFLLIMPLVLGVVGVGGLVLLFVFLLKRTVSKSAETVDSGQVAQRKLRKLGTSLSAGMPPHECYEELSNIMRTFLETHYRISALEAVTQEIERDLKKLGVAGFESIMNLLRQADLVKFADSRPDVEESRQSLHKASEVIRSTRRTRHSSE